MKLNKVAVTSNNIPQSVEFYSLLGLEFEDFADDTEHVETVPTLGGIGLMIDSKKLIKSILKKDPVAPNHSMLAIECDKPEQVDEIISSIKEAGFDVEKEPWDAFWGQRYAIVKDPAGYLVDLYCWL